MTWPACAPGLAVVKPLALGLRHQAKPATSLKDRRRRAGRSTGCLAQVIQQTTQAFTPSA